MREDGDMHQSDGWANEATRLVAEEVRADPLLLMEVLERINSLQDGLGIDQLREAAGAEVHGVWACRADDAPVAQGIDWSALGESFTLELLGGGLDRGR